MLEPSSRSHHEHDASASQSVYFTPPQSTISVAPSGEEEETSDGWGSDVATVSRVERPSSHYQFGRKGKGRAELVQSQNAAIYAPLSTADILAPSEGIKQASRAQLDGQPPKTTTRRSIPTRNKLIVPASNDPQPRASSTSPPPLVRAESPDLVEPFNQTSHSQLPGRPPRRKLNMEGNVTFPGRSFRATKDARAPAFCELCKLPFRNYSALQRHMADTKARHPFYCQDCMMEYEDFVTLQDVS